MSDQLMHEYSQKITKMIEDTNCGGQTYFAARTVVVILDTRLEAAQQDLDYYKKIYQNAINFIIDRDLYDEFKTTED
jgi:hypothetical protein